MRSTGSQSAAASRPTTAAPIPATAAWTAVASRAADQSGSAAAEEQERRQEDRDERDRRARHAVRRRVLDRAEVRREGEQRARHGLGCAVARQECLLGDPPGCDDGVVEERQHDVAAAEDERARAVEGVRSGARRVRSWRRRRAASPTRSATKQRAARSPFAARSGTASSAAAAATGRGRATAPISPGGEDRHHLPERARAEQRDRRRGDGERGWAGRARAPAPSRSRRSATTAAAASSRPCTQPAPARSTPRAQIASAVRTTAEGSVNPSQAARPPSLPARWTPIAIPSWLDDGPGRRFVSATSSPNCSRRSSGGARRTRRGSSRCARPGRRTTSARDEGRRGNTSAGASLSTGDAPGFQSGSSAPASALAARARMNRRSERRFR